MAEPFFDLSHPETRRLAAARVARAVAQYHLPPECRRDLEQEALIELWRKRARFDPGRATESTFADRIVGNRLTSLMRGRHWRQCGRDNMASLEEIDTPMAPNDSLDVRIDVRRVLATLSEFDRGVAVSLLDLTPAATSRRLRVARSTVYCAIGRLRSAFLAAGFVRGRPARASSRPAWHARQCACRRLA
jgi:DNA-directed RNA polymerase specialized sigma24 family protein